MALVLGCEPKDEPAVQTHSARRAEDVAAARLADKPLPTVPSDVPVRPASPAETQPAPSFETINQQVPDPLEEVERVNSELASIPAELQRIQGKKGEHFGLLGMRERVQLFDGELMVTSAPGKGTTVVAQIPVEGGN
jgi:hypothetical protein